VAGSSAGVGPWVSTWKSGVEKKSKTGGKKISMAWSTKPKQADWPASVSAGTALPAAAPPAEQQTTRGKERKLVERKSPELVQFDAPGVVVCGVIKSIMTVDVAEKDRAGNRTGKKSRCVQYTFYNDLEKKFYKILGTYDINNKIGNDDIGLYCEISYIGENKDVGRNGNAMKEFHVLFEERSVRFSDGTTITDEDIPF
jgi:hypothetical protein